MIFIRKPKYQKPFCICNNSFYYIYFLISGSKVLKYDVSGLMRSSLSRLIQQIIKEATALPNVKEILCNSIAKNNKLSKSDDFNEKSYEDILATAILNKVKFISLSFTQNQFGILLIVSAAP